MAMEYAGRFPQAEVVLGDESDDKGEDEGGG